MNIIIIGENEFNGNFFTIKNLMTGDQKELKINQISIVVITDNHQNFEIYIKIDM